MSIDNAIRDNFLNLHKDITSPLISRIYIGMTKETLRVAGAWKRRKRTGEKSSEASIVDEDGDEEEEEEWEGEDGEGKADAPWMALSSWSSGVSHGGSRTP
ncbi:hypothetical protein N7488_008021 [Penicillium malachiteum]|nr:hypothetical protein N7488_008021 [Penicillium malachiteum]